MVDRTTRLTRIMKTASKHCKSYFCKPYASYEKGTAENINRLIRRFFPTGTNLDIITNEEIAYVLIISHPMRNVKN